MQKITVLQRYWFDRRKISLSFPDKWNIDVCNMAADKWKPLAIKDMKDAIDRPIKSKSLEVLAKGKKEACILFDDMTRPTMPYKIVPYILEKLQASGIAKKNIRFIAAPGSHGALSLEDFRKKLGKDIVADYPVYNHNCFENCVYAGKIKEGIPLYLNKEFMLCDLKIGIGSVFPHIYSNFGGGGKIILPGISHIKTIEKFHTLDKRSPRFGRGKGGNCVRALDEAARLSGLQFKIDFLINTNGDEVACFAGDPIASFKQARKKAREAYKTIHDKDYDVIIANAFMKSNEADLGIHNVIHLINPKKAIFVLVTDNPRGQINHYLLRSYGKFIGGRQYKVGTFLKKHIKYIIFSPQKDYAAFDTFDKPGQLIWKDSWESILKVIKKDFSKPKIAVFKDATTQLI